MTSSNAVERRLETIPFPSVEDFRALLNAVDEPGNKLDRFAIDFHNITADLGDDVSEVVRELRFEKPPTYADLGAFAVFLDDLDAEVGFLQRSVRSLRETWNELSSFPREGYVRSETRQAEDGS